ncbi:programmed cell death 1 ligand 1-like [Oreochromis aureus]|uniref:programmed cell death 1 ligand 1-like n=1 Tax=Oreochromis aureus TaxID=47969 RepID=UPI00195373CC|nr:programmed cell death 1 ligand 1-like [Oreochromis aureus]
MSAGTSVLLSWTQLWLCLLLLVHADQKNITSKSGQNVTLPCRAPNKDIRIIVLEWSRADLGDEYVLSYRDEQFDPEQQHPSFKNRVDLQDTQMKDGNVSLIVKNVTTADSGMYKCRAFLSQTRSWESINNINLSVDPPGQTGGGRFVPLILCLLGSTVIPVVGFLIYRRKPQK